jgi:hypothetical protein
MERDESASATPSEFADALDEGSESELDENAQFLAANPDLDMSGSDEESEKLE